MAMTTPLHALCARCGHAFRFHFGAAGPCIHGDPSGQASVCPCVAFVEGEADG